MKALLYFVLVVIPNRSTNVFVLAIPYHPSRWAFGSTGPNDSYAVLPAQATQDAGARVCGHGRKHWLGS